MSVTRDLPTPMMLFVKTQKTLSRKILTLMRVFKGDKVSQESKDHLDHKVHPDLPATTETMDAMDKTVGRGLMALTGRTDRQGMTELTEQTEHQGLLDPKDHKDRLGLRDRLGLPEMTEHQDKTDRLLLEFMRVLMENTSSRFKSTQTDQ